MKPILKWLEGSFGSGFEYEYKVTSGQDLLLELGEWASTGHETFPILYVANYGDEDELARFTDLLIGLPCAQQLRESRSPHAIHFGPSHDLTEMAGMRRSGSLSVPRTSDLRPEREQVDSLLREVLETTGAASVSGYLTGFRDGAGWLEGTIADLTLFYNVVLSCRHRNIAVSSEVMRSAGATVRNRAFRMRTPGKKIAVGGMSRRRPPPR
ncbi:MAG: hypothetical protein OXK79_09915 [Chloroflexota bacterium]|nr:hypothetical protein [Chloroflexota bacterium]